jgi:hypothetical protein
MSYADFTSDASGVSVTVHVGTWLSDIGNGLPEPGKTLYRKALTTVLSVVPTQDPKFGPVPHPTPPTGGTDPSPSAFDPEQVIDQIVAAINAAEHTLNGKNFSIMAGSVEVNLTLPIGTTKITFNINPTPYS